jgi:hypothetical protein
MFNHLYDDPPRLGIKNKPNPEVALKSADLPLSNKI